MARAMNPQLRVFLVRDGSLLDDVSLAQLEAFAEQHDMQVWMEIVSSTGDGMSVVIEDGQASGPAALEPAGDDEAPALNA
jgi:hypothetical protein